MYSVSNGRVAKRFASNAHIRIVRSNGDSLPARVIDRSTTGLALLADTKFEINETVTVFFSAEEGFRGRVVRYFAGGAAIRFEHTHPIETGCDSVVGANDTHSTGCGSANKRRHERIPCDMETNILLEDWDTWCASKKVAR